MRRKKYTSLLPLYLVFIVFTMNLSSCSYRHYKGFQLVSNTDVHLPVVFDSSFNKTTYLTKLKVFNHELSGITIIKKVKKTNTFHVVFMSQIGLKYFDLVVRMGKPVDWFKINYIMESLNKEFIVKALQSDFQLLFAKYPNTIELQLYQHPENGSKEITITNNKKVSSYLTNPETQKISLIELKKGISTEATISLATYSSNHPPEFNINNKKAGIQLVFKEIKM